MAYAGSRYKTGLAGWIPIHCPSGLGPNTIHYKKLLPDGYGPSTKKKGEQKMSKKVNSEIEALFYLSNY